MSFPYHTPPVARRGVARTALWCGMLLVTAAPWWFGLYEIVRAL